ncbi:protein kinase [Spirillospora sp. NPDC047279]|uniref:protein kinase domain-containing protein n=1 Tax=Spirillospora sp. NPDC047279 TaxID=3155478 RepID=UPI0033C20546
MDSGKVFRGTGAIESRSLDGMAALDVLRQVGQGLVELAGVPMLHRDLKPANVLAFGDVWRLADFGLSRDLLKSTACKELERLGCDPEVCGRKLKQMQTRFMNR